MKNRPADKALFNEDEFVELYIVAKQAAYDRGYQHALDGLSVDTCWYDTAELRAEYLRGYAAYQDEVRPRKTSTFGQLYSLPEFPTLRRV
jgi:ribosome modulation factor